MAARNAGRQGAPVLGSPVSTLLVAPAMCVVLLWLGLPGFCVIWLALVARGDAVRPPELTGPRRDGRPTVGTERERKQMASYLRIVAIRDSCLDPATLAPGWPVRASWLVAVLAGTLAWLMPQAWEATRWVNALPAVAVVAALAATGRRKNPDEPSPGTRVDTLPTLFRNHPVRSPAAALAGGVAGAVLFAAGSVLGSLPWCGGLRTALLDTAVPGAAPVPWPEAIGHLPHTPAWQFALVGFGLGALAGTGRAWRRLALQHWRQVVQAREDWTARWTVVKAEPAPRLVDQREIESPNGQVIVETFTCQPGFPAERAMATAPQLKPALGDDSVRLAMLPQRQADPGTNRPVPGTASTLGFRAVRWPGGLVDVTDPAVGVELVELALESAMAWAAESTGWSRMLLVDVTRISALPTEAERGEMAAAQAGSDADPEGVDAPGLPLPHGGLQAVAAAGRDLSGAAGGHRQAWAAQWSSPIGMEMVQVRLNLAGVIAGLLGCEVLVDHRAAGGRLHGQGVMYAGALTDATSRLDPDLMPVPGAVPPEETMQNLALEDWWVRVWAAVLGSDANPPTPKHNVRRTVTLPGGTKIVTQPFVVRQGQDPRDFCGREAKLASAMDSASFVAVTGFPDRSSRRPGERHPMAFQVHYARGPVPGVTALPPCPAESALPVLAGRINGAFRAAKFPPPEVYAARCLTEPSSDGHIWEATVRLHDGVTLADLRVRRKPLAIALGVRWLRIVEHGNDCRLVAGVDPAVARMGERERAELAGYDWEQVWRDAQCTGADGALPSLIGVRTLPSNDSVSELVFRIPSGLDVPRLKAAKAKLAAASRNGFVDVGPGAEPSTVRVLAARTDPMPADAPYRFGLDPGPDRLAFADGIDGEPIVLDLTEVAHLLLTGTSGGGKTTAGRALLHGALAAGAQVAVIDVQKGCADFRYAEPWCIAMAGELTGAAATMTALYAEVRRRAGLNAEHGVGSTRELPEDLRPPEVFVVVDEFFGLISSAEKPSARPEPNPDLEAARVEAVAAYDAKARIAYLAGRIGAEARSAGFHLVLMTQALLSRMKLPSSIADLKLNSNRILLGKATHGERVSALRLPESAPDPGEVVPRGRAVYEPVVGQARLAQFWYATTGEYRAWLEDHVEKLRDDQRLDVEPYRMDTTVAAAFVVTDHAGDPTGPAVAAVLDEADAERAETHRAAVEAESALEVFDDLELPELVGGDDVDWSIVVGADPPEGREPADAASGTVRSADDADRAAAAAVRGHSPRSAGPEPAGDDLGGPHPADADELGGMQDVRLIDDVLPIDDGWNGLDPDDPGGSTAPDPGRGCHEDHLGDRAARTGGDANDDKADDDKADEFGCAGQGRDRSGPGRAGLQVPRQIIGFEDDDRPPPQPGRPGRSRPDEKETDDEAFGDLAGNPAAAHLTGRGSGKPSDPAFTHRDSPAPAPMTDPLAGIRRR